MHAAVHQDIPALAIDNITKQYFQWQRSGKVRDIVKNLIKPEKKAITALDHLSLTVKPGEFVAYAGANGAGKSTTIKILSGILQPTQGKVSVLGLDPVRDRIALMKQAGVLFGQRTELWWDHPVITSFEWKKQVWNIPDAVYNENLAMVRELLDLDDILKSFARELSLGQRMRADIAMLLLHSPSIIFLDEPTLGLDVLAKQQMIRFLKEINKERGTTIVVTSHDMDDLEQMAQRMVLLNKGKIAFDGDFDSLRSVLGGLYRISVTTEAHSNPPVLEGMKLLHSENGVHEYEFDKSRLEIHQVLGLLAGFPEIKDVEIQKAPIEDVIADLYLSWKK
jgi:ABC-2 type transport system ATP-binding protein